MKRLIIILASVFLITLEGKATSIPLDSIKSSMLIFLNDIEYYDIDEILSNRLIIDKKRGTIKEGKEGVFFFAPLISSVRKHYVLINKNSFQFLNMKEPLEVNILKLLDFLEKNRYNRKDILFYLRGLIDTYEYNEENMKRFDKVIK